MSGSQALQALLEVEGGLHQRHVDRQSHQRHGDVGRDPDDDGPGAAQPRHVGQVAQRARGEGVEDVEGGDVDDDPAATGAAHPVEEVALQPRRAARRPAPCGSRR